MMMMINNDNDDNDNDDGDGDNDDNDDNNDNDDNDDNDIEFSLLRTSFQLLPSLLPSSLSLPKSLLKLF